MFAPKPTSSGEQPRNAAAGHVRLRDDQIAAPAGRERATEVRVRLTEVAGHRLDDLVRNLRAAGAVEKHGGPAQRGVAAAYGLDVERDGAHRTSRPFTRQR